MSALLGYIAIPLKPDGSQLGDEVLLLPDPNTRVGIQLKTALKAKQFTKMRKEGRNGQPEHVGYYVDGKPWIVYEVHHWSGTKYD